jgi:predicted Rossmann fold nucleotide-binding protein DprA/Smf involved in DNA uptake
MNTRELTKDAKAILLLCGRFGKNDAINGTRPLSLSEYNRLAGWLVACKARPADLLSDAATDLLAGAPAGIDTDRAKNLLSRGAAMALAVEKWTNNGIWVICRSDAAYPERLKHHLKKQAPPILYGIGEIDLVSRGGLAVVGSRNIDNEGELFTRKVAEESARQRIQIVSGGARGVDQIAMLAALEAGGTVLGVLADSLMKAAVSGKYRRGIREKQLTLISPYNPDARFNVGNAMARNKYIYALADCALVAASEYQKGGTWAGAREELKRESARAVFVRDEGSVLDGNNALKKMGALAFPKQPWGKSLLSKIQKAVSHRPRPVDEQRSLFEIQISQSNLIATTVKEETRVYSADEIVKDSATYPKKHSEEMIPTSIYEAVIPVILNALKEWKTSKELATELNVRKGQLDDWVKQALAEGRIETKIRPVRYRQIAKR